MEGFFLWQTIGAGLMTAAPALTFSLKKLADEGRLGEAWAKTLNAGLVAAAGGHLAGTCMPVGRRAQGCRCRGCRCGAAAPGVGAALVARLPA